MSTAGGLFVGGMAFMGAAWYIYKYFSKETATVPLKATPLPLIDFGHSRGYDRVFIGNISLRLGTGLQYARVDLLPNYEEALISFALSKPGLGNAMYEIIAFASEFLDNYYILDQETKAVVLFHFRNEMELHSTLSFTDEDEE